MIEQHLLKEKAAERLLSKIDPAAFQQIDAADSHISWEEEGKEFYLYGQLYDVAKKETVNGKTILYCINDAQEEQLLKKLLKDISSQQDQNGNKDGKHPVKIQAQDFTLPAAIQLKGDLPQADNNYAMYLCNIISFTKEINTPPPNKMQFLKI